MRKKITSVCINPKLAEAAKMHGINFSAALEETLMKKLAGNSNIDIETEIQIARRQMRYWKEKYESLMSTYDRQLKAKTMVMSVLKDEKIKRIFYEERIEWLKMAKQFGVAAALKEARMFAERNPAFGDLVRKFVNWLGRTDASELDKYIEKAREEYEKFNKESNADLEGINEINKALSGKQKAEEGKSEPEKEQEQQPVAESEGNPKSE